MHAQDEEGMLDIVILGIKNVFAKASAYGL